MTIESEAGAARSYHSPASVSSDARATDVRRAITGVSTNLSSLKSILVKVIRTTADGTGRSMAALQGRGVGPRRRPRAARDVGQSAEYLRGRYWPPAAGLSRVARWEIYRAAAERGRWSGHMRGLFGIAATPRHQPGMVLPDRIELSTSPLPMECSTTELRQHTRGSPESAVKAPTGGAFSATSPPAVQARG